MGIKNTKIVNSKVDYLNYKGNDYKRIVNFKNVKNTSIKISSNGILKITLPLTYTKNDILFIEKNQFNIIEHFHNKLIYKKISVENKFVFLDGKKYKLNINIVEKKRAKVWIENTILYVQTSSKENVIKNIEKFIKNFYLDKWINRMIYYSDLMNANINELKVKKMTGSWGIYHTLNSSITLNLKLAFFSEDVQNYVIIHEIAHFFQPNHSNRFWEIVEKYDGDYKKHKKELKNYAEY